MKNTVIVLLTFFFCGLATGQVIEAPTDVVPLESDTKIYHSVEVQPKFQGGVQDFRNYIAANYNVPDVAGLKGKIFVKFVIEKDGSLSDIKVVRDLGYGTAEEAIRVLSKSPKWTPASIKNVPVRVLYSFPIAIDSKK